MISPQYGPQSGPASGVASDLADSGFGDRPDCPADATTVRATAGPLPVLVLSSNRAFTARLRDAMRGSAEVALTVGQVPALRTPLDRLAAASRARVVVADAALVDGGPIDCAKHDHSELELLVLFEESAHLQLDVVLANCAHGCIDCGVTIPAFVRAVHAVAAGELWLPRWMLQIVYEQAVAAAVRHPGSTEGSHVAHQETALTPREVDVLQLVRHGLTNKVVARQLGISPSTVKKHLHNALRKSGLFRRRQIYE